MEGNWSAQPQCRCGLGTTKKILNFWVWDWTFGQGSWHDWELEFDSFWFGAPIAANVREGKGLEKKGTAIFKRIWGIDSFFLHVDD